MKNKNNKLIYHAASYLNNLRGMDNVSPNPVLNIFAKHHSQFTKEDISTTAFQILAEIMKETSGTGEKDDGI